MLIDLEFLNVIVGHTKADRGRDHQDADSSLRGEFSAERTADNHQSTRMTNQDQDYDHMAIDPVEEHGLVSDGRDELEDHQHACRHYSTEMQGDADAIMA